MEDPFVSENTKNYVRGAMRRYYGRRRARGLELLRRSQAALGACTHQKTLTVMQPDSEGPTGIVLDEMAEERCAKCRILIGLAS